MEALIKGLIRYSSRKLFRVALKEALAAKEVPDEPTPKADKAGSSKKAPVAPKAEKKPKAKGKATKPESPVPTAKPEPMPVPAA